MNNSEIYELVRRSKAMKAKVPKVVLLHAKTAPANHGEMHQFAKLTDAQVYEIQNLYHKHGERVCDLARQFNISYDYAAKVAKMRVRSLL